VARFRRFMILRGAPWQVAHPIIPILTHPQNNYSLFLNTRQQELST
jgi:hypothetical protein